MLNKDRATGALILIASILVIIIYGWLLFFINTLFVLQITGFIVIFGIFGILGWIGWTMASTSPPASIEAELSSVTPESSPKTSMESPAKKNVD